MHSGKTSTLGKPTNTYGRGVYKIMLELESDNITIEELFGKAKNKVITVRSSLVSGARGRGEVSQLPREAMDPGLFKGESQAGKLLTTYQEGPGRTAGLWPWGQTALFLRPGVEPEASEALGEGAGRSGGGDYLRGPRETPLPSSPGESGVLAQRPRTVTVSSPQDPRELPLGALGGQGWGREHPDSP